MYVSTKYFSSSFSTVPSLYVETNAALLNFLELAVLATVGKTHTSLVDVSKLGKTQNPEQSSSLKSYTSKETKIRVTILVFKKWSINSKII